MVWFTDEADAVRWANDTEHGLVAYVFTADLGGRCGSARRWRPAWSASTAASCSDPAAPFGGVKQSGLGREGGHDGLLEFTETKYVAVEW